MIVSIAISYKIRGTPLTKSGENTPYVQAGGVVADSDPESEYQETLNKAKVVMKAAESAHLFG